MPTVIGTVTRTTVDTGMVNSPGDQQSNRAAFVARNAAGAPIGHAALSGDIHLLQAVKNAMRSCNVKLPGLTS